MVHYKSRIESSFRDPSGFVFTHEGVIFRQVNMSYKEHYDWLMESGLYDKLIAEELLIPHNETFIDAIADENTYKIIRPEKIPFISYPYEWSFSQLKQAALTTLRIQKTAIDFGMVLKDSSAYNIQFLNGKPVFIDTLSFEKYFEGDPWIAYRQFCQHFLAPLALMSFTDIRLSQLLKVYLDGIPLDLTTKLLPIKTRFKFSLLSHIYFHAASQKKYQDKPLNSGNKRLSKTGLLAIVDSLETAVKKLKWLPTGTEWSDYYDNNNYSDHAFNDKKGFINECLDEIKPKSVWDLGANMGVFSELAAGKGANTVAFDIDPAAVEKNFLRCSQKKEKNILPLVLDLVNPSPAIGWGNTERTSFAQRGPADMALALALVHHLAISNNVPLQKIAHFLSGLCKLLIIEFVPKADSQVQVLLATRKDIFNEYNQQDFEKEFNKYFAIIRHFKIKDSERILYLMQTM